jgi:hypothetical protein
LGKKTKSNIVKKKEEINLYLFINNSSIAHVDLLGETAVNALYCFAVTDLATPEPSDAILPLKCCCYAVGLGLALTYDLVCTRAEITCTKIGERGRDGTLPFGNVQCLYSCGGVEGFIPVGPGEPCPENPLKGDVTF